jgi:hypothetical protein
LPPDDVDDEDEDEDEDDDDDEEEDEVVGGVAALRSDLGV